MAKVSALALTFVSICMGVSSASLPINDEGAAVADVLYPRYSACRRGREFAIVVPETERADGQLYHERVKSDGKVKFYICAACSVCADYGLVTAAPCMERANTECSADCLVPGFVFDETSTSCRLPSSTDTMIDTVSTTGPNPPHTLSISEAPVKDNLRPLLPEIRNSVNRIQADEPVILATTDTNAGAEFTQRNLIVEENKRNEGSKLQPLQSITKPQITPKSVFTWKASEALFVGTGIVVAVVITNIAAILYIRHKNKQSKQSKRPVTNSAEVLYAALARARTDSNVVKSSEAVSV